jgi:hypothetical protein
MSSTVRFVLVFLLSCLLTVQYSACDTFTLTADSGINTWWFQFTISEAPYSLSITCAGATTTLGVSSWGSLDWVGNPSVECPLNSAITAAVVINAGGKSYTGSGKFTSGQAITIQYQSEPATDINVTIDITSNRVDVNPHIFGVNHADSSHLNSVPYTVNRKGGNAETRMNWEKAIHSTASDWFYQNVPDEVDDVAKLPEGTPATKFVDTSNTAKAEVMLTAPLIGYTPLDERVKKWGFSVSKYGNMQKTECTETGGASWCIADAGNGIKSDGKTKVTGNDWRDTSKKIDQTYVQRWIQFLQTRGTPVKFWSLDNEWDLWSETHRDVHPTPGTYTEYWDATVKYASAIKTTYAQAQTFGPVAWGWCGYFFSPADECVSGTDRKSHGDVPFIPYYLQQLANYKKANGVQLVDYLDIHYYPQAADVSNFNAQTDTESTAKLRFRSLKSLYDPNYVDESWIAQPIKLIPLMKSWINQYYPGLKLAITEYNFGNNPLLSGGLAQVEVLGIFAREGVDLACRWVVPDVGSEVEKAFKLYLNYDGSGAKIKGQNVKAVSSDIDRVGSYAFHDSVSGTAYIILVNKDTQAATTYVTLSQAAKKQAKLYGWAQEDTSLKQFSTSTADSTGKLSLSLRKRSVTLAVIPAAFTPDPEATNVVGGSSGPQGGQSSPQQSGILQPSGTNQNDGETSTSNAITTHISVLAIIATTILVLFFL